MTRFEDPNDPERRPAKDFGVTRDGKTDWFLDDRQQSIIIRHERKHGVWMVAIEDYSTRLTEER